MVEGHRLHARRLLATALVVGLVCSGCGSSKPARLYRLSTAPWSGAQTTGIDAAATVVGLAPIQLATYLQRPQIVSLDTETRLNLGEFDRWAEPLEGTLGRALKESIRSLMDDPASVWLIQPWGGREPVDLEIRLRVDRLDLDMDRVARLDAEWQVVFTDDQSEVRRLTRLTRQVDMESGDRIDYDRVVATYSEMVSELGREVVRGVKEARGEGGAP